MKLFRKLRTCMYLTKLIYKFAETVTAGKPIPEDSKLHEEHILVAKKLAEIWRSPGLPGRRILLVDSSSSEMTLLQHLDELRGEIKRDLDALEVRVDQDAQSLSILTEHSRALQESVLLLLKDLESHEATFRLMLSGKNSIVIARKHNQDYVPDE